MRGFIALLLASLAITACTSTDTSRAVAEQATSPTTSQAPTTATVEDQLIEVACGEGFVLFPDGTCVELEEGMNILFYDFTETVWFDDPNYPVAFTTSFYQLDVSDHTREYEVQERPDVMFGASIDAGCLPISEPKALEGAVLSINRSTIADFWSDPDVDPSALGFVEYVFANTPDVVGAELHALGISFTYGENRTYRFMEEPFDEINPPTVLEDHLFTQYLDYWSWCSPIVPEGSGPRPLEDESITA